LDAVILLLVSGLTMGAVYALVAVGFFLIASVARTLNFAHGSFVVLGGLISYSVIVSWGGSPWAAAGVLLLLSPLFGVLLNRTIILPLSKRPPGASIIALLTAGFLIDNVAILIWGKDPLPFPSFVPDLSISLGTIFITGDALVVLLGTVIMLIACYLFLERTMLGKAIRAVGDNRLASSLVGINDRRVQDLAVCIAVGLAMIGGFLIAPINYAGGILVIAITVKGFTAMVLGGTRSFWGPVTGGVLLGLMEAGISRYLSSGYREIIIMSFLLLILLLAPQGLQSFRRRHEGGDLSV
jgi:branched-chain amino acid transport system permease protein